MLNRNLDKFVKRNDLGKVLKNTQVKNCITCFAKGKNVY